MVLLREDLQVPENGREVEPELKEYRDERPQVAKEDENGRGEPRDPHQQHDHGKQVVKHLQRVQVRNEAVYEKHDENQHDEEDVNYQRGKDFDHREHPDAEGDLLYDEAVLQDGVGAVVNAVAEKEPRDHAADEPQDIRDVVDRF